MRYYINMGSMIGWMAVLAVFGALFLRQRIRDWRQQASDVAVKNAVALGLIGFIATFLLLLLIDTGQSNQILAILAAVLAWLTIISGLESMARDVRARTAQQRAWEQRMRNEARYRPGTRGQVDPELLELIKLEEEQNLPQPLRKPVSGQPVIAANMAKADEVEGELDTAAAAEESSAPLIGQAEMIFAKHAPGHAPTEEPAPAAPDLPAEITPAAAHAHGAAADVQLGVTSRFGARMPAATVSSSPSVRLTAPMIASPTIASSVTQLPQSAASAVQPEAIALPATSMPDAAPVSTTPGAVKASSAPHILGPSTLGSSGRFSYQPKLVQSRLGAASTSAEKLPSETKDKGG